MENMVMKNQTIAVPDTRIRLIAISCVITVILTLTNLELLVACLPKYLMFKTKGSLQYRVPGAPTLRFIEQSHLQLETSLIFLQIRIKAITISSRRASNLSLKAAAVQPGTSVSLRAPPAP